MSLFVPHHKPVEYFTLHDAGTSQLLVRMDDGAICSRAGVDWHYPDPIKDGWERPLRAHLTHCPQTLTAQARVLCAIMDAVQDLPEDHVARCAIIGSTITEVAEDTLAHLVPESRRPTGAFPVFEALSKVLEAIDICEVHP